jgi:hypothetical protein
MLQTASINVSVPICRKAEAHIMHGSTVTYKSVSRKIDAGCEDKISSIASNSACLVAYKKVMFEFDLLSCIAFQVGYHTLSDALGRFPPFAKTSPFLTKTQPTGTSREL